MRTLAQRIEALETRKTRLERIVHRPDPMAAFFPVGVGCMSAGQARRHSASTDSHARRCGELVQLEADLKFLKARQKAVAAGECYENGQRCANAPSRQRERTLACVYADFLRATCKPGCQLELLCNGSLVTLRRVNGKRVTVAHGDGTDTWEPFDLRPLNADGSKMTQEQFKAVFKAWRTAAAASETAANAGPSESMETSVPAALASSI